MTSVMLFLLGACFATSLLFVLALLGQGIEVDLHLTCRIPAARAPEPVPAPLPPPATTVSKPGRIAPPHTQPARVYAEMDLRLDAALERFNESLARIIDQAGPQAALVAANTARRMMRGDTPKRQLLDFVKSRLELIALGTDRIAAQHAQRALALG